MSSDIQSARIETHDITEHNFVVSPWQLRMQQMSLGPFSASFDALQLNGILLTHENWSQQVIANGVTPEGYLALAGPCTEKTFFWCGQEIDSRCVGYGFDASETDFLTPVDADHWVILVPQDLLIRYLGEETAAKVLRGQHVLSSEPILTRRLFLIIDQAIRTFRGNEHAQANELLAQVFETELMDIIVEILLGAGTNDCCATPRKRFLACRRAILHAENMRHPQRAPDLATAAGVSQRVLEMGFKEMLSVSPQKFLRWRRMNCLRRDLHSAQATLSTVTDIAHRWGFQELGRTAVEYRQLFGESPSSTLSRESELHSMRLADTLPETSNH